MFQYFHKFTVTGNFKLQHSSVKILAQRIPVEFTLYYSFSIFDVLSKSCYRPHQSFMPIDRRGEPKLDSVIHHDCELFTD